VDQVGCNEVSERTAVVAAVAPPSDFGATGRGAQPSVSGFVPPEKRHPGPIEPGRGASQSLPWGLFLIHLAFSLKATQTLSAPQI
jgi:hypothetical protein